LSATQNRWSQRRAAVKAEAEADAKALQDAAVAQEHAELEEKTDAQILAELELPDPDSLKKGDDFSVFMKEAVPERIRKRALRKLWLSNPVLANVDNLVDYGEDFAAESKLGVVIKTTYQVGKGMLKHIEEMERQEKAKEDDVEIIENSDEDDTVVLSVSEQADAEIDESEEISEIEASVDFLAETNDTTPFIRRKLRFEFVSS